MFALRQTTTHPTTTRPCWAYMHAKSGLRVLLKWMIAGSGSVITDVMPPQTNLLDASMAVRANVQPDCSWEIACYESASGRNRTMRNGLNLHRMRYPKLAVITSYCCFLQGFPICYAISIPSFIARSSQTLRNLNVCAPGFATHIELIAFNCHSD